MLNSSTSFEGQSILALSQFSREGVETALEVASGIERLESRAVMPDILRGRLLITLFYEPSTRTRVSFQAAMLRLGGQAIDVGEIAHSSVAKGEDLEDTLRTLRQYADVIVLRHGEQGAMRRGAASLDIPLINAGDGAGEHPTQALLDMYTIKRELGRVDGLKIGMMGDLKYGRTVHSLAQCATLFENELYFISPQELRMPENIRDHLRAQHARWYETERLSEVLAELDVLYVTRIQRERFEVETVSPDLSRGYRIDARTLQMAKPSLRILHPLPRVAEIAREVDDDPRAAYFRQVRYGLLTRMALLALLFGRADTLGKQEHAELPPNEIWRDS